MLFILRANNLPGIGSFYHCKYHENNYILYDLLLHHNDRRYKLYNPHFR